MVIAGFQLRALQTRFLDRIVGDLTANPTWTDARPDDPSVMQNLRGMPPEKLAELEADIRLLYDDVRSYF